MSLGWTASLESCGLSHFLPAFWTEFGPRGDRFSAVGTRRHGLCGRRYEHGGSAVGAESGSLLNTVSHLGHATSAAWGCADGCIWAFITWGMRTIPAPKP